MLKINSEKFRETLEQKYKEGYKYLVKITAVDYNDRIEVLYFVRNLDNSGEETIRFDLSTKNPHVPTVLDLYLAADWYERELSEMFGIKIDGRKARRLLLEKWDGKDPPMRKSFVWSKPYEGMKDEVKWAERYREGDKKEDGDQNVIRIGKPLK
ncbi:MAG: NADH-quinone oxidoreductase subunit C [Candidatus Micrarchaeota archaeon]|nr:NADH-quinone oxidoreductase subunit C [Candidatus Micrarchaeota archaeon]